MSKTILLGGSGFLGPVILKQDPNIISVGRTKLPVDLKNKHINLNNLDELSKLDSLDFDKVIFLIGSSNHHEINMKVTMGIDFNVYPTQKILEYLSKRKIKKFICFTTILLYDQKKFKIPVSESQLINPYINKYVFSKYMSEQLVEFYAKKIPSIIVRLSNIYGYTKLKRPDLIPTIMQDIFKKKKVKIWSDKPIRDFIFVEDAAEAILKLINSDFTGTVNLANGVPISLKSICNIIKELSGKEIISENKIVSGPMKFVADISKLKKIIDWAPKYDIHRGLKKTYEIMSKYNFL
jgi:nucleoside-diphosphate-sugar epimerase